MFQIVNPVPCIGLTIVPLELSLSIPSIFFEISAINSLVIDLHTLNLHVFMKFSLKYISLTHIDTEAFAYFMVS
jgi:hypothetical protein